MDTSNNSERSAVQLLQEINSGILDPRLLNRQSRQACVELLISEGYTQAHIAQVLKCSEKTVYRDIKEIESRNALTPDVVWAKTFIGNVFAKAMVHHNFLMRIARSKDASISEKIMAESEAWKIIKELVEKFQTLGYLPSRPQEIVGDIFCHINRDEEESFVEIQKMILELEAVIKEENKNENLLLELEHLKRRLEKAQIYNEVKKISQIQNQNNQNKEEANDRTNPE